MTLQPEGKVCKCGDTVTEFQFHIHNYCKEFFEVPESDYKIQCIKFVNHKDTHYFAGFEQ